MTAVCSKCHQRWPESRVLRIGTLAFCGRCAQALMKYLAVMVPPDSWGEVQLATSKWAVGLPKSG